MGARKEYREIYLIFAYYRYRYSFGTEHFVSKSVFQKTTLKVVKF